MHGVSMKNACNVILPLVAGRGYDIHCFECFGFYVIGVIPLHGVIFDLLGTLLAYGNMRKAWTEETLTERIS